MKDKILRLCKRLNKFALDEIELISETEKEEILLVLNKLVIERKLIFKNDIYFYNKEMTSSKKIAKLPLMFQFHSPEKINIIIRAFCSECPVGHANKILDLGVKCVNDFYRYFRDIIYNKQKSALENHFKNEQQKPFERIFFGKKYYFYNYENKIYVSELKFKIKEENYISFGEQRYFKIIYSRLKRRLTHNSYEYYTLYHLIEQIWRQEKSFEELLSELQILLRFEE